MEVQVPDSGSHGSTFLCDDKWAWREKSQHPFRAEWIKFSGHRVLICREETVFTCRIFRGGK